MIPGRIRALLTPWTRSSDISFKRDDAYSFMPRILALVTLVSMLMLLGAVSVSSALEQSSLSYRDTILIHIPDSDAQAEQTMQMAEMLAKHSSVADVSTVGEDVLAQQLSPWLGNVEHASELPMPTLLKVRLAEAFSDDVLTSIEDAALQVTALAVVDAPTSWSEDYRQLSVALRWILLAVVGVLLLSMGVLLSYMASTAIKLHRRTVVLLHSIGATDNYIAAQFQRNSAWLALRGAGVGALLAAVIYVAIGMYMRSLDAAMLPQLSFGWQHAGVVIVLPLVAALIGLLAGRIASMRYLRRLM